MAFGLTLWGDFFAASTRVTVPAEISLHLSAQLPARAALPATAVSTDVKLSPRSASTTFLPASPRLKAGTRFRLRVPGWRQAALAITLQLLTWGHNDEKFSDLEVSSHSSRNDRSALFSSSHGPDNGAVAYPLGG